MEEINFGLSLCFTDPRPLADIRDLIVDILGCPMKVRETDDRTYSNTLDGEVLGIYITLSWMEQWPEGHVYRLTGQTKSAYFDINGNKVALNSYVARILRRNEIGPIFTMAEYAKRRSSTD